MVNINVNKACVIIAEDSIVGTNGIELQTTLVTSIKLANKAMPNGGYEIESSAEGVGFKSTKLECLQEVEDLTDYTQSFIETLINQYLSLNDLLNDDNAFVSEVE